MSLVPSLVAPALDGAEALILVPAAEEKAAPDGVRLNPVGEWTLALAWIALVAINLWTWRMILKKRGGPAVGPPQA